MKNNFTLLFLLFFLSHFAIAQTAETKVIKGQISSGGVAVEGINVTNASTKIMVTSDSHGVFSVLAKEGDVLNFSSVNYEDLRKYLNSQEIRLGIVIVDLIPKSIKLEEVVINEKPKITAESLGLIPHDFIRLTKAERQLGAASKMGFGGGMGFDPLINAISGRTKMLKKELKVEKKEFLLAKLDGLFDDKYYIGTLKIPEEYIKGFQYYCVEDPDFARSLKEKNKTKSMFLIVGLASDFNKNRVVNSEEK